MALPHTTVLFILFQLSISSYVSCLNPPGYLETYPKVQESSSSTPLYFGLIMSFPGGEFDSSGAIAGVRVALDRINNDPTLLPNYILHYTLTNSSCNRTVAFSAFFDQVLREPTKVALIGSGCSVATEPTAEVSQYYNLTQISCVSSSTALSDRTRFRRYFQLLPSEDTISPSYYGVIKAFGWKRVSIIVQNENLFSVTITRLKDLLKKGNITFDERIFETDVGIAGLGDEPFDPHSRIHIIATYSAHARHLLCEAFHRQMKFPVHLLLTAAWYAPRWWLLEDEDYSCTAQERESVLPTSLAFLHFEFLEDDNLTTTTGITGAEYNMEEEKHLNEEPFNLTRLEYAQYCYDATWTLAYALNQTIKDIERPSLNEHLVEAYGVNGVFEIENFTYQSDALTNLIFNNVEDTSFSGITGNVSFNDNGVRAPNMQRVYQFRNIIYEDGTEGLGWYEVGQVIHDGTDFVYTGNKDIWPDGLVPYDGVPTEEYVTVGVPVTVVYILLSVIGIIFAVLCLIFNFMYRNKRLIRLTSPNLNYLIGFGAIILYLVVLFTVVPASTQGSVAFLCNLIPWLTAIGYSLCFGTIVAKMFRIYYIFTNPHSKKRTIQDWLLSLIVMVFVLIDLIILVTYTIVVGVVYSADDGLGAKSIINAENPEDEEGVQKIITRYYIYVCDSRSRDIFLGILYGYKALLQIVAMIFAFSIRKVKVKGLNDTKFIVAIVYVTSIATATIIVAAYTLNTRINGYAALFSSAIVIGTTTTLGLVFVPKMISLYKDPDGNKVFGKSIPGSSAAGTNTYSTQNVETLKNRIKELESLVTSINGNDSIKQNGSQEMKSLDTKDAEGLNGTSKYTVKSTTHNNLSGEEEDTSRTIWNTNGNTAV